jgi:hypothetical protein
MNVKRWLDAVRTKRDPREAYTTLLAAWRRDFRSSLWDAAPRVDLDRDIAEAAAWLKAELRRQRSKPTGIACLLDTLNMQGPHGFNVELVSSRRCDPRSTSLEWVFGAVQYGKRHHLIRGLARWSAKYHERRWSGVASRVDYAVPLGYSGIVLAGAAEALAEACPPLVAWGFHDGDLFVLGRREFVRLATDGG